MGRPKQCGQSRSARIETSACAPFEYSESAPPPPSGLPSLPLARGKPAPPTERAAGRQSPDKILDAPDLVDDYYLNLLDWCAAGAGARGNAGPAAPSPRRLGPRGVRGLGTGGLRRR